jgi:hypothetical protein
VFAALMSPRRLILVPGAHHNESLNEKSWAEIEAWIDTALATKSLGTTERSRGH